MVYGGEGGIRTHGTVARLRVFESGSGPKRKWCRARVMSVISLKGDIRQRKWHIRLVPEADVSESPAKAASCPTDILCNASNLLRWQQCSQGDTADAGENRAVDKYSSMANVVPQ